MLLEAQPASATPYTPSAVMANSTSKLMFTSAMPRDDSYPQSVNFCGPKGITAKDVNASINATNGAMKYAGLSTLAGMGSSLKMNFNPSASGCIRP